MTETQTENPEEWAYNLGQQAAENWTEEQLRESEYYENSILPKIREKAGYLDLEDIDKAYSCPESGESQYLLMDMKDSFWDGFHQNSD